MFFILVLFIIKKSGQTCQDLIVIRGMTTIFYCYHELAGPDSSIHTAINIARSSPPRLPIHQASSPVIIAVPTDIIVHSNNTQPNVFQFNVDLLTGS